MWVKIYMNKYSLDQVRGGSYSRTILSRCQIIFLRKYVMPEINAMYVERKDILQVNVIDIDK
jgi:hypothetical protein